MPEEQNSSGAVSVVAEDVLETFERVELQALRGLQGEPALTGDSIGIMNPVREAAALRNLDRMNTEKALAYQSLSREPAIARVVVSDKSGQLRTWYVSRTSPPSGVGSQLISYRSPMGALASRSVGDSFVSPGGEVFELRERALLHPVKDAEWDSRDNLFESHDFKTWTVLSLRGLLAPAAGPIEDILAALLAEEEAEENLFEGRRRSVITKMGLRDQPVLDKFQDEIFRLPLSSRLLILGPPGTGKTTTLIRRLGQKLDTAVLDEGEQRLVQRMDESSDLQHAHSWLMFTPTELLRQYVKEAFQREGIPAPEQRISTWAQQRTDIARNHFNILRSGAGSGIFVEKATDATLSEAARERPIDWYDDFDAWQTNAWLASVRQAAEDLKSDNDKAVAALAKPALDALAGKEASNVGDAVVELTQFGAALQTRLTEMRSFTNGKLRDALTLQVNRNRGFLDELARFMESLQDTGSDTDDDDDDAAEDEEIPVESKTTRNAAMQAYESSLRTLARSRAMGNSLKKGRRSSRIVEWLGDRGLSPIDLTAVGRSLVQQSRIRRLLNPAHSFINGIPQRYRGFRRARQAESSWYRPATGYLVTDLDLLELDVVLLATLRNASNLLVRAAVQRDLNNREWAPLRTMRALLRHQVLVDEATDFSPIQLACMAALANPAGPSFFACGDFNQRLTRWGSRSLEDMRWACPDLRDEAIRISYRQTTQLNELAKSIAALDAGDSGTVSLPDGMENEGVAPVLVEGLTNPVAVATWLAARIREIEAFSDKLPTIAVLVIDEQAVEPLANALSERLLDINIKAVASKDGKFMGNENDVRVFDIQHIKGLEFEAVFFIGVDRLAVAQPGLFDKYLYVGTTRAATYLGMSCDSVLPPTMASLRPQFAERW
ncbi:ATP-binding domain-containing protein [Roseateles sp.]|uniref:ATP-binding domain-containing protein n=1 Tax=Roseateles sp. TaxID=1971397 RepID=UPI002F3F68B3